MDPELRKILQQNYNPTLHLALFVQSKLMIMLVRITEQRIESDD